VISGVYGTEWWQRDLWYGGERLVIWDEQVKRVDVISAASVIGFVVTVIAQT
jgi:hypothetical protein